MFSFEVPFLLVVTVAHAPQRILFLLVLLLVVLLLNGLSAIVFEKVGKRKVYMHMINNGFHFLSLIQQLKRILSK